MVDPKECISKSGVFTCTNEGSIWGMWVEGFQWRQTQPYWQDGGRWVPVGTTSSLWKRQNERWKSMDILPSILLMLPSPSVNRRRTWISCFLLVSASKSLWSCGLLDMLGEMLVFKDKFFFVMHWCKLVTLSSFQLEIAAVSFQHGQKAAWDRPGEGTIDSSPRWHLSQVCCEE